MALGRESRNLHNQGIEWNWYNMTSAGEPAGR